MHHVRTVLAAAALLATTAIVAPAQAQFSVTNTAGGDGYLTGATPPYQWELVGANNGASGNLTLASATAAVTGNVTFDWLYQTFDSDGANYDHAGYFINGSYWQLSNNGGPTVQSGTVLFNLAAGDTYGFYIDATDAGFGPGTISFASQAVPEPASWAMMLGGFGLVGGAMRARRKVAVSFA